MIKNINLQDLKQICENATKSPWKLYIEGRDQQCGSSLIMTGDENDRDYDIEFLNLKKEDQDFIVDARNNMPLLIDEI
jgi:hypothetical protein